MPPAKKRARPERQRPDPLAPGGSIEELAAGSSMNGTTELPTLTQLIVRTGVAAWSLVGALLLVGAIGTVLGKIHVIFPPIIFGLVIVLLLEPVVAGLVGRGIRRGAAVAIAYVALIGMFVVAGYFAIPAMVHQGQQFVEDVPSLVDEGGSLAASTLRRLNQDDLGRRIRDSITDYLNENAASLGENVSRFASIGLRLANFFVTVVVGLFLGLYLLLAMPRIGETFTRVVPAERRASLAPITARMRDVFTGYLRARLIVSLGVGALAIIGLWLVGMPFWLILGVVVGVTNLIPMIGSFIGGIPVVLVALVTKPPLFIVLVIVVLIVVHAVDGYILSPKVLRTTTNLHPIVVLLAVIIGGALLGLWGIIASVPLAGAIQVIVLETIRRRRMEAEAAEPQPV